MYFDRLCPHQDRGLCADGDGQQSERLILCHIVSLIRFFGEEARGGGADNTHIPEWKLRTAVRGLVDRVSSFPPLFFYTHTHTQYVLHGECLLPQQLLFAPWFTLLRAAACGNLCMTYIRSSVFSSASCEMCYNTALHFLKSYPTWPTEVCTGMICTCILHISYVLRSVQINIDALFEHEQLALYRVQPPCLCNVMHFSHHISLTEAERSTATEGV